MKLSEQGCRRQDFGMERVKRMKQKVKIWDMPTRLFHWSLPLLLGFMWFSAETGGAWLVWHKRGGLLLLALLVFRLVWGFIGSDTARFAQFVKPQNIAAYLRGSLPERRQVGHNPLGALMVLALLGALLFQVGTGLFAADENTFTEHGYLYALAGDAAASAARSLHDAGFGLLSALIVLHIAAAVFYRAVKKQDLVGPMVRGWQWRDSVPPLRFAGAGALLAAVLAGLAAVSAVLLAA